MTGEKNNGRVIPFSNPLLQIQAVDVRKLDIEDQAGGYLRFVMGNIFGSRCKSDGM
jgi:hypothetical protein